VDLEIWLGATDEGELIAEDRVTFYGMPDGQSWLEWVWDTAGVVGPQTLSVTLDPDDKIQIGDENSNNNFISRTIELRPRDELPAVWADAQWNRQSSACCVFHYISGTAVERDIEVLVALADEAIAYVGEQLGEETDQVKLDVYLISRVLGHGGFAGGAQNEIGGYLSIEYELLENVFNEMKAQDNAMRIDSSNLHAIKFYDDAVGERFSTTSADYRLRYAYGIINQ